MNQASNRDSSLYQLALKALKPSQSLRISPNTLKAWIGNLIDVLIDGQILVTIWVKLPLVDEWLTEIKRYQKQVEGSQKIYLCLNEEAAVKKNQPEANQIVYWQEEIECFPIRLGANSQVGGEYFLLIISDVLNTLIVARQTLQTSLSLEMEGNPFHPLSVVVTFEQHVIQQAFERIKEQIIIEDSISNQLQELWENPQHIPKTTSNEKTILAQLLVKQIQNIEDINFSNSSLIQSSESVEPRQLKQRFNASKTALSSPNVWLQNKEELLKRIAQELRTPLANMKTALKLLDATQLKSVQRQRYMQLLNTECDRQNCLITGLLELVQLDSEPQPTVIPRVQLVDILPGVVSTYQPLAQEKGIRLGYTIASGLPAISCLETWLRQILINLLNNSLKFTPSGGQVKVQATLQGEYVQLGLNDTGIGIAAHEIPRIFDSFYRGRSTMGEDTGAGLGLTLVQELLLRCGGSISVTSKLGEGSDFKVLFPIASATPLGSQS
jgi:signal transduction histidine kinase